MTLSEAEKVRALHVIKRLRACLDAAEIALTDVGPIGYDTGNAVMHTALELGTILAKMDAYQRAEHFNSVALMVPVTDKENPVVEIEAKKRKQAIHDYFNDPNTFTVHTDTRVWDWVKTVKSDPEVQREVHAAATEAQKAMRYSDEIEAKLKVIRDLYGTVVKSPKDAIGNMYRREFVCEYLEPVGMSEIVNRHKEKYFNRQELLELLQRLWEAVLPNAAGADRYVGGNQP